MTRLTWAATLLGLGLIGCGAPQPAEETAAAPPAAAPGADAPAAQAAGPTRAVATLQTAQGASAGTATATLADGRVMISLAAQGLPPGRHGVHIHTTGRCDPPSFESAGAHWNPTSMQHGLEPPPGQHAGDMPNLTVGPDGRGSLEYHLEGGDFTGLLDQDGSAFIVHAAADDQRTDPSGNSGDRIACGVFNAG